MAPPRHRRPRHHRAPPRLRRRGGRHIVGLPLIALGALIAVAGYREWVADEVALRTKAPPSRLPLVVTGVLGVIGVLAFVFAVLGRAG